MLIWKIFKIFQFPKMCLMSSRNDFAQKVTSKGYGILMSELPICLLGFLLQCS